jgi:hypothetical protein
MASFDDALWRKVFEVSSEHGLYWAVRFKDEGERVRFSEDPGSCYRINYEPMERPRIEDHGIKDGLSGPLRYSEILWIRFPRRLPAGSAVRVHSERKVDLSAAELALTEHKVPYEAAADFVHVGARDT